MLIFRWRPVSLGEKGLIMFVTHHRIVLGEESADGEKGN